MYTYRGSKLQGFASFFCSGAEKEKVNGLDLKRKWQGHAK